VARDNQLRGAFDVTAHGMLDEKFDKLPPTWPPPN
jgi:hypothetical protein